MKFGGSILDTVVQSATVELFHSYGVAVAPIPRKQPPPSPGEGACGTISFNSKHFSGAMTLVVPMQILVLTKVGTTQRLIARDWVRELTNQLMGRIKSRLLQLQVTLQTGLPSAVDRRVADHRRQPSSGSLFVYEFRTIREDIVVVLEGTFDETALKYSGTANPGNEGDVIIF